MKNDGKRKTENDAETFSSVLDILRMFMLIRIIPVFNITQNYLW